MVQISEDGLIGALTDSLQILRGTDSEIFGHIHSIVIDWLGKTKPNKVWLKQHANITAEQLIQIGRYSQSNPSTVHTRTWAKAFDLLTSYHPQLSPSYREIKVESIDLLVEECLRLVSEEANRTDALDDSAISAFIEHFVALTPKSRRPKDYENSILSQKSFSEGLSKKLAQYNSEIRFLTEEQISALSASLKYRRLWVSGAAGTGKTIFAVEAAYRALRAGSQVLIIYRTTQFKHVFQKLLDEVSDNLLLLSHLDFMYLVRMVELHGLQSKEFKSVADGVFETDFEINEPPFDMLLMDDCGTYESQLPYRMEEVDKLAHRIICLAAPDQIMSHIVFDFTDEPTESGDGQGYDTLRDAAGVLDQKLEAPESYNVVNLSKNIRNSRNIIQFANTFLNSPSDIGIKSKGSIKKIGCNIDNFDSMILKTISNLVADFEPQRIKILVDPHFRHPKLSSMSMRDAEENFASLLETLPPILRACVIAAKGGSFLHSTMESEDELREVLNSTNGDVCFVYTDGEDVGLIEDKELSDIETDINIERPHGFLDSIKVDAKSLFLEDALADPFESCQAIMIYQAPLFIGLESDAIIYVHNAKDAFESSPNISIDVKERLKDARNEHHFLAVTRAKYQLVDVSVRNQ